MGVQPSVYLLDVISNQWKEWKQTIEQVWKVYITIKDVYLQAQVFTEAVLHRTVLPLTRKEPHIHSYLIYTQDRYKSITPGKL